MKHVPIQDCFRWKYFLTSNFDFLFECLIEQNYLYHMGIV